MGRGERTPRRRSARGVTAAASAASTAGATGGAGVPKKKKKKAKTSTDSEGPQAPVFSEPALAYVANMVGRLMRLELEMGGEQMTDDDVDVARRRGYGDGGRARGTTADDEHRPQLDTRLIENILTMVPPGHLRARYDAATLLATARLTPAEAAEVHSDATAERHAVLVVHQMVELCIAQADRMSPGVVAQTDSILPRIKEQIRNGEGEWPGPDEPGPIDRAHGLSQPEEEVRGMCEEFDIIFESREQAAEALQYPLTVTCLEDCVQDIDEQQTTCESSSKNR
eukprot:COSAG02_NODE_2123_length_9752_cov_20.875376_5_plen_283_part_00